MKKFLLAFFALLWAASAQAQTDSFLATNGTFKSPFALANTWTALQTFNGGVVFGTTPTLPLTQNQFFVGNGSNQAAVSAFTLGRGSLIELGASTWQTIAPGSSGFPFVSNGAAADPSYQLLAGGGIATNTVANSNLTNMAAGTVKGNPTGSSAAPVDTVAPVLGVNGGTGGSLTFNGATSGALVQNVPAVAGTPTVTWGSSSGTPAVTASSPLGITTSTGNATCATCATTTNGGALSATAPVAISAGGAISCSTCATTTNGGALSATFPISISAGGAISFDSTAWPSFSLSPSCGTATFGNVVSTSKTFGKVTFVKFRFTITAVGTCAGNLTINLPNTLQGAGSLVGDEFANTGITVSCSGNATATMTCIQQPYKGTAANPCSAGCAVSLIVNAWETGDDVRVSGVYENQ